MSRHHEFEYLAIQIVNRAPFVGLKIPNPSKRRWEGDCLIVLASEITHGIARSQVDIPSLPEIEMSWGPEFIYQRLIEQVGYQLLERFASQLSWNGSRSPKCCPFSRALAWSALPLSRLASDCQGQDTERRDALLANRRDYGLGVACSSQLSCTFDEPMRGNAENIFGLWRCHRELTKTTDEMVFLDRIYRAAIFDE